MVWSWSAPSVDPELRVAPALELVNDLEEFPTVARHKEFAGPTLVDWPGLG